ncbi:hypothetical protein R1sor_021614 [Riccia sorocarpa]|uniref:non-specific serine/threonine protein kinase n=1 Tax=Riccia sorocarpa TaxID=122646 RepID=A0ABD3GHJ8_9MARC
MVELPSSTPSAVLGNMYQEKDRASIGENNRWSPSQPVENYAYPRSGGRQNMAGVESRVENQPQLQPSSRVEGYSGGTYLFRRQSAETNAPWLRRSSSDKQDIRMPFKQRGDDQEGMERPSSAGGSRQEATSAGTDAQRAHSERLGMVGAVDMTETVVRSSDRGQHEFGNRDRDHWEPRQWDSHTLALESSVAGESSRRIQPHWFPSLPNPPAARRNLSQGDVEFSQFSRVVTTEYQANKGNRISRAMEAVYRWSNEEVLGRHAVAKVSASKDVNKEFRLDQMTGRTMNMEEPWSTIRSDGGVETESADSSLDIFRRTTGMSGGGTYDAAVGAGPKNPIRRSYSDEGVLNDPEIEVTPSSSSAEGHNMLSWRKVLLDDIRPSYDLPVAPEPELGLGQNILRIGRSSVQQLVRKLQIRTPQKQDERGDWQRVREEQEGDEDPGPSDRVTSATKALEYMPASQVASESPDEDGSVVPFVLQAKPFSRGTEGGLWDGGGSQKEVIKEVIVNSTNTSPAINNNSALSRSSSESAQGLDVVSTLGSPMERNCYDKAWAGSGGGINFQQAEEDFQLQLALALRVAAEAAAVDDPDLSANVRGPKGNTRLMPGVSKTEATAYRYWVSNCLSYDDRIEDGFYEVWGMSPYVWSMCTDSNELGRMPPLENLRSVHPSDATFEVVLVDRNMDPSLRELEDKAVGLAYESSEVLDMASKLSIMISSVMGGPSETDGNMMELWNTTSSKLMQLLGTIVLPIGLLRAGLSRHRALLFKVLADSIGLPCRLVRGSVYCGKEDEASVVVKCGDDREWMVDLMIKPGTIMAPDARLAAPPAVIASPLQFERPSPFAGSSVTVHNWARHEPGKKEGTGSAGSFDRLKDGAGEESYGYANDGAAKVNQGLEFSQTDTSGKGSRGSHGSNDAAGRDRLGVVSLLERPGPSNAPEQPGRREGAAGKGGFLTVDVTRRPVVVESSSMAADAVGNQEVKRSRQQQERSSKEGAVRPYDGGWAKDDRRVTGLDEYSRSSGAGRMLDQIASEASDFEIGWEDIIIGERIGQGSYGKVYRADWQGSDVAVKVFLDQDLKTEALEEFKSEVAIMRRLRHPNIVLFMGAVTKPPNLSIITEFCPRGSLYRLLHRPNRELDERKRIRMAVDVVKGMNYLHRCSPPVVHRDLKSPNLLVDKNWTVKVCDFGLSRQKHSTFLSSKSSAGTPEWMAPEVLRNEPSDEKSDVYSFGVILWELATLQVPWNGMNPIQVVGAVGFQHRRLPTDTIDPALASIIQACWRTDSKLRPSFADLMVELKNLQARPLSSPSQSPSHTPQSNQK